MCKHYSPHDQNHPENPSRIKAIWEKLHSVGIPQRCVLLDAKEAEDKHIMLVHSQNHVKSIKDISSKKSNSGRARIASKYDSIYFNEGSSEAAYLAVGSVIEVIERVARGELNSAVAIVRPPGHHAERDKPMGFCLYNNVAVAASFLLNEKPELGINRILIVDWDIHHGNGTQKMFWENPRVLFFSVHSFYPANDDGFYTKIGEGAGAGYNVNVPWENDQCGDADYIAVWDHILVPIAKEFNPEIVIISAGFDAAVGDPLGGCCVTPYGYSVMLKKLMDFAHGKIVLALEGGYNIKSTANSMLACVKVLQEDKSVLGSSEACPLESTWRVIQAVRQELKAFWPTLGEELPKRLINGKTPTIPYVQNSTSNPDVEDNEGPTTKFATENFDKLFQFVQEIEAGPSLVERIMQNCWPPGLMSEISKYNAKERCQLLVQGLTVIGSAVEELEQAYSDDQANVDNLNGLVHALRVELEEERAVKAKLAAKVAEAEKKAQEAISEKMKSDSRVVEVEARVTTMEAKIAEERKTLKGTLRGKEEEILRLQEQMFEVGILRSRIAELEQKSIHAQIAAVKERMADAKKLNLRYQTEMQVLAAELYKEATEQALLPPERRKFTPESYARKMGVEPFNFNVQYYLDRLGAEVEVTYPEWVLREIDVAERAEAETSKAVEADMRNPAPPVAEADQGADR